MRRRECPTVRLQHGARSNWDFCHGHADRLTRPLRAANSSQWSEQFAELVRLSIENPRLNGGPGKEAVNSALFTSNISDVLHGDPQCSKPGEGGNERAAEGDFLALGQKSRLLFRKPAIGCRASSRDPRALSKTGARLLSSPCRLDGRQDGLSADRRKRPPRASSHRLRCKRSARMRSTKTFRSATWPKAAKTKNFHSGMHRVIPPS